MSVLGLCRYLTVQQVLDAGLGGRTEEAMRYRLRGLAGEATRRKVRAFRPPVLRSFRFRAFDGTPLTLWGLTGRGYRLATEVLDRPLQVPRVDVGAPFAEHFVALTDLFVRLVAPYTADLRALPFRWDVGELELPWREPDEERRMRSRVLRPDAVLTLFSARRRFFIECEMGSNTLVPEGPRRRQAVQTKLERYETYHSGFAGRPEQGDRLTHYQRRYPDGFACEVLFLIRGERRQRNTAALLEAFFAERPEARFRARALTLPEAEGHVRALLPPAPGLVSPASGRRAACGVPRFYGEPEHRAVKDFVLDMHAALAEANRQLRALRLPAIPEPSSAGRMAEFLRRAQGELARTRGSAGRTP